MKVVGLRIEKYIGQIVEGYNCDFEYVDEELEKYIILGVNSNGQKVEISLWEEYGQCPSGYTTASWGCIDVMEVDNFNGYQYRPKEVIDVGDITLDMINEMNDEDDCISNIFFRVSSDGGDCYYPHGYVEVNMDMFIPTGREKFKRPVWIFEGDSNLGKSYLAHLTDKTVYETDSSEKLPNYIVDDIVVIGNKYKFDEEEIISRLFGEVEVIKVAFKLLK